MPYFRSQSILQKSFKKKIIDACQFAVILVLSSSSCDLDNTKRLECFFCSADGLFDPLSQVMEKVIFRSVTKLAKMSLLYF